MCRSFIHVSSCKIIFCALSWLLLSTVPTIVLAQNTQGLWSSIPKEAIAVRGARHTVPQKYRTFSLNKEVLGRLLSNVPTERNVALRSSNALITLPMPDGSLARFRFVETATMAPELAAQFPEIRTFSGVGLDSLSLTATFDFTPAGFHGMIHSPGEGLSFIDPFSQGDTDNYQVYAKKDYVAGPEKAFIEERVEGTDSPIARQIAAAIEKKRTERLTQPSSANEKPSGDQLRTYRVAIAATREYTTFHGGTVAKALAAINTTLSRVNLIYIRELAIRMILVANNTKIIWTNAMPDPYDNGDASKMIVQNQTTIDSLIGSSNYDIGHVFGTNSGGLATLGSVCSAGKKAQGVTGSNAPIGDAFDVDYVAHEMGHQFGANHTFNGNTGSCASHRKATTAFEPGSGSTIMAYAGICGAQNLQSQSDAYFHTHSYDEIFAFSELAGGNGCAVITNTGNTAPVPTIVTPNNLTIPRSTPFTITGNATDSQGQIITYCWEQYNLGSAGAPNVPVGDAPIFRSFLPSSSTRSRTFPKLSDLLNNTQTIGEILPSYMRTLTFRLTVRDNQSGGGGVNWAGPLNVKVDGTKGPFLVTSPNTNVSWIKGSTQNVTWNVAGSNLAPVSCANVKISLSTDGGDTFPLVLLASTPNDGSQSIVVPNNVTTKARVKIEAVGNIFFDISNTNFSIVAALAPPPANLSVTALNRSQIRLNWSDVSEETGYRIYRAVSGGGFTQIDSVGADVTTFTDSRLTAGVQYAYYLQAYNASGNSSATPVVNATTATSSQYVMDGTSVSTCSGTFYDPGFTSDYRNNQSFTQTFSPASAGSKVRLTFSSFHTDSTDFLRIYNGPTTASPLIGAFTGTTSPRVVTATNPTGQLTLQFTSNGSGVAPGWVAAISCVSPSASGRQSAEPELTLRLQASPNPFAQRVTFNFTVEKTQSATLEIYDQKGVLVKKLFDGEAQAGQHYQVEWNAALLKSGLFIGRLTSGNQSATQKVILQR